MRIHFSILFTSFFVHPVLLVAQPAPAIDLEASFAEAEAAASVGDYRRAVSALERVLILDPTLDNIRLELGVLYLRLGATDLAEELIREALDSPEAPPDVRARAEELLALAVDENRRFRWSGELSVGMIGDTNANAGPDAAALPGFNLDPKSTGQSDLSAFGSLAGRFRYDPGLQAGHLLALDAEIYGRGYRGQTDLNLLTYSLEPGVDLNLSRMFGNPASLQLRYVLDELRKDGEKYVAEHGAAAALSFGVGEAGSASISFRSVDQNYFATDDNSANDDRDGRRSTFGANYRGALSEVSAFSVGFGVTDKSAEASYEAYEGGFVAAGYERLFEDFIGAGQPVLFDLTAMIGRREYDSEDPEFAARFGVSDAQWERYHSITASLSMPVLANSVIRTAVGYSETKSNYEIDSYDNTYVLIEFTRDF